MTPDLPAALIELPRLALMEIRVLSVLEWMLIVLMGALSIGASFIVSKLLVLISLNVLLRLLVTPERFDRLEGAQKQLHFAVGGAVALIVCIASLLNWLHSYDRLIGEFTEDEGRLTVTITARDGGPRSRPSCLVRARQTADGRLVASVRHKSPCPQDEWGQREAIRQALLKR